MKQRPCQEQGNRRREKRASRTGLRGWAARSPCANKRHSDENFAIEHFTEGRKKVGEEFTCPVDGMRMSVTENTPATEYRGKTDYFCNEADKRAFLQDPERYVKGKSAE